WAKPKVAAKYLGGNFLVVAQRGAAGSREIWGRTVSAALPASVGAQLLLSGPEGGEKINPTVGGDPNPYWPTYFCLAYERVYSATDHDIHARLFDHTATLNGNTLFIANGGELDEVPAISKSDGNGSSTGQFWNLVWQRDAGGEHDIYGTQILWDST